MAVFRHFLNVLCNERPVSLGTLIAHGHILLASNNLPRHSGRLVMHSPFPQAERFFFLFFLVF
ncbi:hypothetical protein HK12_00235 [Acetobacter orientalis]|uniref:Uncharacterized protein n=1 Tax=Acetobacter orientalis TaxID=146474 RepID=A0A251ZX44_9PROT|nr:hypothetical protein HK12_00235 [Acetobacter orientalis]